MTDVAAELPVLPDAMVQRLIDVVGADSVIIDRPTINEFKDKYWFAGDETYAASAVVQPVSVEQIQEIVRIANEFGIPVWPHGQGKNLGYGGPSPRVRGSIQLGFQKMNRVLEINSELAYAVVEPGVRWFDLYDAIEAGGHPLMMGVPDLGWGSVIGNSMDSGITYTPYGSEYMMPCGMEVVLGDGDLLRLRSLTQPPPPSRTHRNRSTVNGRAWTWQTTRRPFPTRHGAPLTAQTWTGDRDAAAAPVPDTGRGPRGRR